jgi:hypothetical protein
LCLFPVHRRWDGRFETERAGHASYAVLNLRAVNHDLFIRRLTVGDRLESDVGNDAAYFLTIPVLLAYINEAAGGAA